MKIKITGKGMSQVIAIAPADLMDWHRRGSDLGITVSVMEIDPAPAPAPWGDNKWVAEMRNKINKQRSAQHDEECAIAETSTFTDAQVRNRTGYQDARKARIHLGTILREERISRWQEMDGVDFADVQ